MSVAKSESGNSGKSSRLSSVSTEPEIYELQLTTLQEQLVSSAIDNQTLKAELDEFKKNNKVDKINKELEYERGKSSQLLKQLRELEAHTRLLESEVKRKSLEKSVSDSLIASRTPSSGSENISTPPKAKATTAAVKSVQSWKGRIQDSVTTFIYDLISDFSDDPAPTGETSPGIDKQEIDTEGDPLTVKQLKDNILRFKLSAGRVFQLGKAIYDLFTWTSPLQTAVAFFIYMYAVWHGWLLPVLLFIVIFRLYVNYLNTRGWKIDIQFLATKVEEESKKEDTDLALSDRFHLVVDVARKVQNTLGDLADYLEKIKNLVTWQQPEETRPIMIMLCLAFVMSCFLSGPRLFLIFGLYFGVKMFIIEYLYSRYPRFKQHHDSTYKMWQALPTDADLEERRKVEQKEKQLIASRQQKRPLTRNGVSSNSGSSCEDEAEEALERELTEDDRNFCTLFALPYSERPLRGWESGWRATLLDKSRPILRSVSRNGRLYLTNSYLCMERNKTASPKNFSIALKDITRIEKVRPVTWMPGGGMCIEIAVTGFEQPYTFAAIVNRDGCFDALVTHGISLNLTWALEHQTKNEDGNEKTEGNDASRTNDLQSTTFRMSELSARRDYDDLTTFAD